MNKIRKILIQLLAAIMVFLAFVSTAFAVQGKTVKINGYGAGMGYQLSVLMS